MGLPVNVPYHPETETPVSLVSRLARAMGFASIDELVRSGGTTVHAVARGEDDAMRTLSSWSGVSTDRLRRFAVPMRGEAGEWRLGDAVFRKEMRVAAVSLLPSLPRRGRGEWQRQTAIAPVRASSLVDAGRHGLHASRRTPR